MADIACDFCGQPECICCRLCGSDISPCDCVEASAQAEQTQREWSLEFEDPIERKERRIREIDAEFGDETENWYHKWNEGLLG